MHTCYFFFSEINKINKNYSIFVSNESGRNSVRNVTMEMESWAEYALVFTRTRLGARLTFILSRCLRLGTASLGTNMIFICHQHGKLSRQRQHRRMIGKEYGTKQWIAWLLNSESQCPGFASYGHRARGPANWHWLHSQHAAFAQMFFQIG